MARTRERRKGELSYANDIEGDFVAVVVLPVAAIVGCQKAALQQGEEAYRNGDFDLAIQCATDAIRLDPTSARAYDDRGMAYYRKGQYDAAIADLTAAIRLNPNYALAYSNRSLPYVNKGQYDQAIADCTAAIRLEPNFALAHNNLGWADYHKGQDDKAIAEYTEAIRLNPKDALAYSNRSLAFVDRAPVRPGDCRLHGGHPAGPEKRPGAQQPWLGLPQQGRL